MHIHPTAIVDDGAEIGAGTHVWHFCHVMTGARIGRDCVLGQNVFVADGVRLGDGVRVQNNVSIYRGVELEDLVFCGPSVVFTNVRTPRAHIRRNDDAGRATTRVRRGATLGANATVVCGVEIGPWAFVGAGAVVTGDVAPHALVVGVPARRVGWVCQCGARLEWPDDTPASDERGRCSDPACARRWTRTRSDDGPVAGVEPESSP